MPQPVSRTRNSTISANFTLSADGDSAARRRGLRRIQQQVHQNLRQLIGVGGDGGQIGRNAVLQLDIAEHRLMPYETSASHRPARAGSPG